MRFFPTSARLPGDRDLLVSIDAAATRLYDRLVDLDVDMLDISDYNKMYFGGYHLKNLRPALQKYAYLLSWSVAYHSMPLKEFIFIDYGGGPGTLSLLAKELGIGTVIYNDIYDVSCADAKVIGQAIKNEADYYVHGDMDELVDFLKANSISCNVITSYDVIEHIYDIEGFLLKLANLSDVSFSVVMASSANPHNPIIKRNRMRFQTEVEYQNREKVWGHKERDSLRAYFDIRKEIISHHAPALSNLEVECLARVTRGLIEPEIKECVDEYLGTGRVPKEPDHPTNTCDPYTGNWAEHLMDINHLSRTLSNEGFAVDIMSGCYVSSVNAMKRLVGGFLNPLIYILNDRGLVLAPFYTIYARKVRVST